MRESWTEAMRLYLADMASQCAELAHCEGLRHAAAHFTLASVTLSNLDGAAHREELAAKAAHSLTSPQPIEDVNRAA